MAIEGLTDRGSLEPAFPFLGWWRKGAPKAGPKEPGKDLEYFRFVPRPGPGADEIAAAVREIYGEKPDSLKVYLPRDRMEEVFTSWHEAWTAGKILKLRCDGRNWVYWLRGWQACHGKEPCTFEWFDPDNRCPTCAAKPVARLSVIMEDLWMAGHVGLITVVTGGINDMVSIGGVLLANEPLSGKEFRLYRYPHKVGAPLKKEGKRISVEKYLVGIEPTAEWVKRQLAAQQAQAVAYLAAQAGGVVVEGAATYAAPAETVPGEEPPEDAPWFDDGDDDEADPFGNTPDLSQRLRGDRSTEAPDAPEEGKTLDRENTPGEGDDWTAFYRWAEAGGYTRRAAFDVLKAYHPGASQHDMPSIEEAVGALLADQDYRLCQEPEAAE